MQSLYLREVGSTATRHSSWFPQCDVGGADLAGGEGGYEGDAGDGGFDVGSAALFAVYEAEDCGYVHSGFSGGFDGGDGGASGGADVVDYYDVGSGAEKTFDAAAGAVGLLGFADEEAVDEGGRGAGIFVGVEFEGAGKLGYFGEVGECPGAGGGGVGDEGVCTHGEATDGFDLVGVGELLDEVVEDEAGEAAAFGVEGGDAAVDVVVAAGSAGEGKVAELEGVGGDEVEEGGVVVWVDVWVDVWLDVDGHGLFDCRAVGAKACMLSGMAQGRRGGKGVMDAMGYDRWRGSASDGRMDIASEG